MLYAAGMANVVFTFVLLFGGAAAIWGKHYWGTETAPVFAVTFIVALVARQWLRLRQGKRHGRGTVVNLAGPDNRDA
jgi:hypothetical protein